MSSLLREVLGDVLRRARTKQGRTLREVSDAARVSLGYLSEVERGRVVFSYEPVFDHYNPLGSIHGGIAATLLDSVMGCAIHTTLKAGVGYTTLEIKVNYVRAMTDKTGTAKAEGKIINVGSRVATAEGRLVDSAGKLLAHGTTTCLIFPL